jgi:HTH-type transcriptional regulator/antitoxin HigA
VTNKTTALPETIPTRFGDLCLMHLPRPINDSVEYENTVEVVDRLATLGRRSRDQEQYLETLTILIERYDRDHFSETAASDPIKRLRRLMENQDMNASDLGRVLGNRSLGAAILRGDRAISKANATKLGDYFKMSPTAFFQA